VKVGLPRFLFNSHPQRRFRGGGPGGWGTNLLFMVIGAVNPDVNEAANGEAEGGGAGEPDDQLNNADIELQVPPVLPVVRYTYDPFTGESASSIGPGLSLLDVSLGGGIYPSDNLIDMDVYLRVEVVEVLDIANVGQDVVHHRFGRLNLAT
jgi:hypothetical protein